MDSEDDISEPKPEKGAESHEMPSPPPLSVVATNPSPALCDDERDCDVVLWNVGVEGWAAVVTAAAAAPLDHQSLCLTDPLLLVPAFWACCSCGVDSDWKSGEASNEPKSSDAGVSVVHVVSGRRVDGGGVCKAERAACVWEVRCEMYAVAMLSLENWNGLPASVSVSVSLLLLWRELKSRAGDVRGVSW